MGDGDASDVAQVATMLLESKCDFWFTAEQGAQAGDVHENAVGLIGIRFQTDDGAEAVQAVSQFFQSDQVGCGIVRQDVKRRTFVFQAAPEQRFCFGQWQIDRDPITLGQRRMRGNPLSAS